MREWPCPRCGQVTSGTYSEGGCKWEICEDCMARDRQAARIEREEEKKQTEPGGTP